MKKRTGTYTAYSPNINACCWGPYDTFAQAQEIIDLLAPAGERDRWFICHDMSSGGWEPEIGSHHRIGGCVICQAFATAKRNNHGCGYEQELLRSLLPGHLGRRRGFPRAGNKASLLGVDGIVARG